MGDSAWHKGSRGGLIVQVSLSHWRSHSMTDLADKARRLCNLFFYDKSTFAEIRDFLNGLSEDERRDVVNFQEGVSES